MSRMSRTQAFELLFSSKKSPFLNALWVCVAAKPIYHQEDRCLRLKVTVSGKISECQGAVGLSSMPVLGLAQ